MVLIISWFEGEERGKEMRVKGWEGGDGGVKRGLERVGVRAARVKRAKRAAGVDVAREKRGGGGDERG